MNRDSYTPRNMGMLRNIAARPGSTEGVLIVTFHTPPGTAPNYSAAPSRSGKYHGRQALAWCVQHGYAVFAGGRYTITPKGTTELEAFALIPPRERGTR